MPAADGPTSAQRRRRQDDQRKRAAVGRNTTLPVEPRITGPHAAREMAGLIFAALGSRIQGAVWRAKRATTTAENERAARKVPDNARLRIRLS